MGILDDYSKLEQDKEKPEAPNAGLFDRAGDLGIDALKGAIALPEAFVGLADIPTGGRVGRFLDEELGYRPGEARDILSDFYSEERKAEAASVSKAFDDSFISGLLEAASEPAVATGTILESLPTMAAGGVGAGAVSRLLPKVAPWVIAGASEGILGAGSAAEEMRYESPDGLLTGEQQLLAMGSGAGTALFGMAGSKVASKFGLQDIDLIKGAKKAVTEEAGERVSKSVTRRILEGVLAEGVLEELPQSTHEAIMMNLASGKEWNEGLSEAAGMGLISGGVMGAGMGAKTQISHKIVLGKKAAIKKLVDEQIAAEAHINEQASAGVGEGTEAVSVQEGVDTLDQASAEAAIETSRLANAQAKEEATRKADLELLAVVADKIVSGERDWTGPELDLQQEYAEELEVELQKRRNETLAREDLHETEKEAATVLDADPTMFRKIYAMAKTAKGFSAELVRRFGVGAKKFADKLWGLFKNSKMFTDERGEIGLVIGGQKESKFIHSDDIPADQTFVHAKDVAAKKKLKTLPLVFDDDQSAYMSFEEGENSTAVLNKVYQSYKNPAQFAEMVAATGYKGTHAKFMKDLVADIKEVQTTAQAVKQDTGTMSLFDQKIEAPAATSEADQLYGKDHLDKGTEGFVARMELTGLAIKEIETGDVSDAGMKALEQAYQAADDEQKKAIIPVGKAYSEALKQKQVEAPATSKEVAKPEVKLSAKELTAQADEILDQTISEDQAAADRAARGEQLRVEDRRGYEAPVERSQVVPEDFQAVEEDEVYEGDIPFKKRTRRELSENELYLRDVAAEGIRTEFDPFGQIGTRSSIQEGERGSKTLTKEKLDAIDKKFKRENVKALTGILGELNNNPEFTIANVDEDTGEMSPSMADIIASDIASLGQEYVLADVLTYIKREEGRAKGQAGPLNSLSELEGYPESLENLLSHSEALKTADDYEYMTETEVNPLKEELYQEIREQFSDKEIIQNSKAIDMIGKNPDALIDFIETEVHQSWDYNAADLKRIGKAFEDEFNATLTPKMAEFIIENVRQGLIIEEAVEDLDTKEERDDALEAKLTKHMNKNEISRIVEKKGAATKTERKLNEKEKIELQYDRFQATANLNKLIDRKAWIAFYRSVAELAGRGVGQQKNVLSIDQLVPIVAQKAGGEFAALQPEEQRTLVLEMLHNSFIREGEFEHKFYREESVNKEITEDGKVLGTVSEYSVVAENADLLLETTQLGEEAEQFQADKTVARANRQRTINIRENAELFRVEYTTDKGRKIRATVDAERFADLAEEYPSILNDKSFESLGKHDIVLDWNWASDVDRIMDIAKNRNHLRTAADMNKMSVEDYTVFLNDLFDKAYPGEGEWPPVEVKREMDRQSRLLSALAAEAQYDHKATTDPDFFDKLAKENPDLNMTGAELYNEFLKTGADTWIFNSRVDRKLRQEFVDQFSVKEVSELSEPEARLVDKENADRIRSGNLDKLSAGKMKSKIAQRFYEIVAGTFGADLVLVSDNYYGSRYIGKDTDGKSRIVINLKTTNSFAGVFAHELFHHVVNKALPGEVKAFNDNIKGLVDKEKWDREVLAQMKNRDILKELAEEEVMAEAFKHVVTLPAFYERLSETHPGLTLAGKLINRLVKNIVKLHVAVNRTADDGIFNVADMKPVHDLVINLLGGIDPNAPVQHGETRYLSPAGAATVNELKGYLSHPKGWLQGFWSKIFAPGTKNYKDLMSNIESMLTNTLEFIKEHKPQWIYADFLADPIQTAIMNKMAFNAGRKVDQIRKRVTDKHKKAFEGMTEKQKERLHDMFVRDPIEGQEELNAELEIIDQKLAGIFDKYGPIGGVKIDNVPESLMHIRNEHDNLFARKMEIERTVVNGIDVGTTANPNANGIARAKELNIGDDIIAAFQDYKQVSEDLHEKLLKIYPELKHRDTHYGQSIRWRSNKQTKHDNEFEWEIDPTKSKLKGSEHFLEEKSTEPTAKIRERGYIYDTIEPGELLLHYVNEVEKTLALHEALDKAGKTLDKESKLIARIFSDPLEAKRKGYVPVNDNAMHILEEQEVEIEGQPIGDTIGYEVIHTPTGRAIQSGLDKQAAEDLAAKDTASLEVKEVQGKAKPTQVGQIYFSKDMARMMNNYLAKDKIRSSRTGEAAMNVKNHMTSLEFAFSIFHALTIGQELIASYSAWAFTRARRGDRKFALKRSLSESQEIVLLAEEALRNPDITKTSAFQKKLDDLLGTQGADIFEIIKAYKLVGGNLHQDTSLRASSHDLGEMKYRTNELGVEIVDGEIKFTGRRGIKAAPADTAKAMADSIKAVFDKEMKNHPDKKVRALAQSMRFGVFQATSAWLMEEKIPQIKMSMFIREYTLRLDKEKAAIESGATTKEAIAHNVMKFIEDRFGEVNWKNQWMDPTAKTFLQFTFRSFTWFTGSWKSLTKAGIDIAKLGWFTAKGEKYELTEKGQWGIAALFTHIATVMMVNALYTAVKHGFDVDEVETEEDVPLITKLLFPRVDFSDPRARVTIPSYISEGYKIMRHIGVIGNEAEYLKLISGRTSSVIGKSIEALYHGEDWRGVSIRDPEDGAFMKTFDTMSHIFGVSPISFSSVGKHLREKGITPTIGLPFLGITDAPAAAKRSGATNKAFALSREEFKGTSTTEDEMEIRDDIRKAMYQYGQGDKTEINRMRREGEISDRQFKNALSKLPHINGRKNPTFVPELQRALKRLTIKSAIEVWGHMTETEKKKYRPQIIKKYLNMMKRQDRAIKEKKEIREAMKAAGIFK